MNIDRDYMRNESIQPGEVLYLYLGKDSKGGTTDTYLDFFTSALGQPAFTLHLDVCNSKAIYQAHCLVSEVQAHPFCDVIRRAIKDNTLWPLPVLCLRNWPYFYKKFPWLHEIR